MCLPSFVLDESSLVSNKPLVPGNLVDAGIKELSSDSEPGKFTIFLPPEAVPGQALEITNEFGDKLVTRVPHDSQISQKTSTRPVKKAFPIVGERVVGQEDVIRKWADVEMEYATDGIAYIVNGDLPPLHVPGEEEEGGDGGAGGGGEGAASASSKAASVAGGAASFGGMMG